MKNIPPREKFLEYFIKVRNIISFVIILNEGDVFRLSIPILDLRRSFEEIKPEVFKRLEKIFDEQNFILGSEVKTFERHCERYLELPEGAAVGCASGTDALLLALMAADVHDRDDGDTAVRSYNYWRWKF